MTIASEGFAEIALPLIGANKSALPAIMNRSKGLISLNLYQLDNLKAVSDDRNFKQWQFEQAFQKLLTALQGDLAHVLDVEAESIEELLSKVDLAWFGKGCVGWRLKGEAL